MNDQRKARLNLLSEKELERIHAGTLKILKHTGVRFFL